MIFDIKSNLNKDVMSYFDVLIEVQDFMGFTDSKYSKSVLLSIIQFFSEGNHNFESDTRIGLTGYPKSENVFAENINLKTVSGCLISTVYLLEEYKNEHMYGSIDILHTWDDFVGDNENIEEMKKLFQSWSIWIDKGPEFFSKNRFHN